MRVDKSARSGGIIRISLIFYNMKVSAAMGFFSYGLKNEFEVAVVNEPSVFEPLKFYCIYASLEKIHPLVRKIFHLQDYDLENEVKVIKD